MTRLSLRGDISSRSVHVCSTVVPQARRIAEAGSRLATNAEPPPPRHRRAGWCAAEAIAAIGYRNLPAETAATFGADGWIRTGDIGTFDDEGRLLIIDRKKELVIPDHGHNIAPSQIESEQKAHAHKSATCA